MGNMTSIYSLYIYNQLKPLYSEHVIAQKAKFQLKYDNYIQQQFQEILQYTKEEI